MVDIETKTVDRESIMGVKTAKKASAKKAAPIKTAKKKISGPKYAGGGKKNGAAALPPVRFSRGNRVDRLEEAMASMAASTVASKKEFDARLDAVMVSMATSMAASKKELDAAMASMAASTAASEALLTQKMAELSERVDKTSASVDKMSERVDNLGLNVGGINNSIGRVVEMVLLPGLMEKLNTQFGYQFDNISPNKIFTAGGKQYA
ncbi:MAG: hypothetical protein LBB74_00630, partial [Chitinispirillales bacterium]|nr:hypothetical protein [Chitinispirillales bacterium]